VLAALEQLFKAWLLMGPSRRSLSPRPAAAPSAAAAAALIAPRHLHSPFLLVVSGFPQRSGTSKAPEKRIPQAAPREPPARSACLEGILCRPAYRPRHGQAQIRLPAPNRCSTYLFRNLSSCTTLASLAGLMGCS